MLINSSLLYKSVYYFGGCTFDYINEVMIVFEKLQEKNIIITFIGDKLSAHIGTLKKEEKKRFQ